LAELKFSQLAKYLPEAPFVDHKTEDPITIEEEDARPNIIFLGIREEEGKPLLPESGNSAVTPSGEPYFAIEVNSHTDLKEAALEILKESKPSWIDLRSASARFPQESSGIVAEAKCLLDWNGRNRFCAGCGMPTQSVWAGWKRRCLPGNKPEGSPPCISKKGVHNFQYPRTDPVIICLVKHWKDDSILLGRNKSWPAGFYSCLAGFCEGGESLEEAVVREIYEESGIRVTNVKFHSSQPWPYPASLMFGMTAVAQEGTVRLDLDNELENARFISREYVQDALNLRTTLSRHETSKFDLAEEHQQNKSTDVPDSELRLPPSSAIAHQLILSYAKGEC